MLERKAWRHFRRQQEAEVIEYISTLNNDPVARGKPWEEHIHQLIETTGLEGTLRNLETDEEDEYILRPRLTSFFDEFDDIDESAQYWRPTSRKHPSCDGYIPGQGIMLQMTVGKEHIINIEGLEKAMNSGIFREWKDKHPKKKLKFIFVVDSAVYSEYERKQTFRYSRSEKNANNKRKNEKKKEKIESQMEQYVLKIDLSARLRELRCGGRHKRPSEDDDKEAASHKRQKYFYSN